MDTLYNVFPDFDPLLITLNKQNTYYCLPNCFISKTNLHICIIQYMIIENKMDNCLIINKIYIIILSTLLNIYIYK